MRKRIRFIAALSFLLLGAVVFVPARSLGGEEIAAFDCQANCIFGTCSAGGWGCNCYCDAGNPHCGCWF